MATSELGCQLLHALRRGNTNGSHAVRMHVFILPTCLTERYNWIQVGVLVYLAHNYHVPTLGDALRDYIGFLHFYEFLPFHQRLASYALKAA